MMSFHKRLPPIGSRPGTLAIPSGAPPPRIRLFDYRGEVCTELDVDDVEQLAPYVDSERVTWIDVQGFGDEAVLRRIAEMFSLHALTLEDATNVPQRAKSQVRADHHIVVARAPDPGFADHVEVPQVFLLIGRHFLLTFQDHYYGFFDPVRERIREGIGPIRRLGPDYLAYALLDTMVDHYFPRLEASSEQLEDLEERVYGEATPDLLEALHRARRDLVVIRRVGWPQREALRAMVVEPSPFVGDEVRPYLASVEQHMTQAMEAVDAARETATGLVEIYLSNVSQRTNEIMKVLTLMASIFIPLTFIAGIYGMNFEHMPELHDPRGYFVVLAAMVVLAVGMVVYFFRRGWLGSGSKKDRS
jgi:magnesium transporter